MGKRTSVVTKLKQISAQEDRKEFNRLHASYGPGKTKRWTAIPVVRDTLHSRPYSIRLDGKEQCLLVGFTPELVEKMLNQLAEEGKL